jgi:uncharacterized membrane protein
MYRLASFEKLLLPFILFIGFLIGCRILYSGSWLFVFLSWNIFLAWIPFRISYYLAKTDGRQRWKKLLLFVAWLLFFPNALYIITDLVHLDIESNVPKWFDAILLFASSTVGLLMAFVSLYRVETVLSKWINKKWLSPVILLILFLGSFGVYLGRFLRWNSWDIITHPFSLLATIAERFLFPVEHFRAWGVTGILTVFFYILYTVIKKMPGEIRASMS